MAGDIRKHPVFELLVAYVAQTGATPTKADLDALEIPADARRRVERASARIADVHAEGHHQQAWESAERAARSIIGDLPDEQQDPDYLETDPLENVTDPYELAAAVERW